MNRRPPWYFLLPLVGMPPIAAPGQTVASESFTGRPLGPGIPATGSADLGWTTDWAGVGTASSHFSIVDPVPNLTFDVSGGGLIDGGNRALMVTTAPEPVPADMVVSRRFAYPMTTTYFRFLIRIPSSGTGTDLVEIGMHAADTEFHTFRFVPQNPTPPVGKMLFLRYGSGFGFDLTGTSTNTHLIVFKSGSDGSYAYWIDPSYGSFNNPKRSGGAGGVVPQFDKISIKAISTDGGGPVTTVLLDEFRVGYTWADVVASPAPAPEVPTLGIETATRIAWQSALGTTYQVQYSYDFAQWLDFGDPIQGDGHVLEAFDSRGDDSKFYRVTIAE